ncbi:MAG: hypothetical protein ABUK20_08580, partial [Anaerolineales bacterium]
MRKFIIFLAVAIPIVCLMSIGVYNLPPVNAWLSPRVDTLRTRIVYALNPPEEAVFIPQEQVDETIQAAVSTPTPEPTDTPTVTPTQEGPTNTPSPSATATITPTAIPDSFVLEGIKYEDQHHRWNYCGPANLSMALTYWGWDGNRDVVGEYIKPGDKDKNV